ncbi:hypothetical protein A6R68_08386, partial [Neotoma lepida]
VDVEGDMYRLEDFIKNRRKLSKYEDESVSPLHHAAAEGQIELMKMIIHGSSCEGANPNLRNSNMMAPLHIAVQAMNNEMIKVLTEHTTTNINLEGENGNTALMSACAKDNSEALKIL